MEYSKMNLVKILTCDVKKIQPAVMNKDTETLQTLKQQS